MSSNQIGYEKYPVSGKRQYELSDVEEYGEISFR